MLHRVLYGLLFLPLMAVSQQFPQMPTTSVATPSAFDADRHLWTEVQAARTEHSRQWRTPDGRIISEFCKRPLNYMPPGADKLIPIDHIPHQRDAIWYAADQQPDPIYADAVGNLLISLGGNHQLQIEAVGAMPGSFTAPDLLETPTNNAERRTVRFHQGAVKTSYMLQSPAGVAHDDRIITLPDGFTLSLTTEHRHGLQVVDVNNAQGRRVARFHPVLCIDAAGKTAAGNYTVLKSNNRWLLSATPDSAWLHDPARVFPVSIDPLITGPTATWAGGDMPSCILPSYNLDSILVTIPGNITITGMYVTSSYYADPFTFAVMADGAMHFSTVCGSTPDLTVAPPTGNSAGTAYGEDINYRSPLTCCLQATCAPQDIWVRMHLGRSQPGAGCNFTYVYYDMFTTWPFSVYVEGRSPELSGTQLFVTPLALCSDSCTINYRPYMRYGVAPYTITHPWTGVTTTIGTPAGLCQQPTLFPDIALTIPGCPEYCSNVVSPLTIPDPVITDACGTAITGYPARSLTITAVPQAVPVLDTLTLCYGTAGVLTFAPCLAASTVTWTSTDGSSGAGPTVAVNNTNDSTAVVWQTVFAESTNAGCTGPPAQAVVQLLPPSAAAFTESSPVIAGQPVQFTDASFAIGDGVIQWVWDFGDGQSATQQSPQYTYEEPGTYTVCMSVLTNVGCVADTCMDVLVIPAEVGIPNIITPNNDGLNDQLHFLNLAYFDTNRLWVYNRWGNLVFESAQYQNTWGGDNLSDGTYFFVLEVDDKHYEGFFQLVR
jgi:gliding motility-associated-like protein